MEKTSLDQLPITIQYIKYEFYHKYDCSYYLMYNHHQLISCYWSISIPIENIKKPLFFWCFQGIWKETSGMKWVKGCVRYIFARLFCISKWEHLWNKKKYFLFHFESSFGFWDNQILTSELFKCHDVIKCLSTKHETHINE